MDINDVRLAAAGDRQAFDRLYREYNTRLLRFANKYSNAAVAEDVVSETFLAAFEHLGELKDPNAFGAWLYSIAYRKCTDLLRREDPSHMSPESADNMELMLTEEFVEDKELINEVRSSVSELSPDMRAAVVLYYYEEYSVAEVARELGIKENAAKQRLYKARKKLMKRLALSLGTVPFGAVLDMALDQSTARAAVSAVKTGAAVGRGTAAAKLIGGLAAAVIAVGVPVGLHLASDSRMGDRQEDTVIEREVTETDGFRSPLTPELSPLPFILVPVGAGAFAVLVFAAVKTGAVSRRRVKKVGIIAAAVIAGELVLSAFGGVLSRNLITQIAAHFAIETGICDRPLRVQSYPDRVYVLPETDKLAVYQAGSIGMLPIIDEHSVTPDRIYGYSKEERQYFHMSRSVMDTLTVSHADPPFSDDADPVGELIRAKTEGYDEEAGSLREYLGDKFFDTVRSSISYKQFRELEQIMRGGGIEGTAAALALDELTCLVVGDGSRDVWQTAEEFGELWERYKQGVNDRSLRLDLIVQIGTVSAVSLLLAVRIVAAKRNGTDKQ